MGEKLGVPDTKTNYVNKKMKWAIFPHWFAVESSWTMLEGAKLITHTYTKKSLKSCTPKLPYGNWWCYAAQLQFILFYLFIHRRHLFGAVCICRSFLIGLPALKKRFFMGRGSHPLNKPPFTFQKKFIPSNESFVIYEYNNQATAQ